MISIHLSFCQLKRTCSVIALLGVTACASGTYPDPYEKWNRSSFDFNMHIYEYALKPIATGYRIIPSGVRNSIRNMVNNLGEPLNAVNTLLQGNLKGAGDSWVRFSINSTFGLLGLFDIAGAEGIDEQSEDFGQTLAVWGVPSGSYVMLPLLGPGSVRDVAGRAVDIISNPMRYVFINNDFELFDTAESALDIVDLGARNIETIDTLKKNSVDFYAATRSFYIQRRKQDINNGEVTPAAQEEMDDAFADFLD